MPPQPTATPPAPSTPIPSTTPAPSTTPSSGGSGGDDGPSASDAFDKQFELDSPAASPPSTTQPPAAPAAPKPDAKPGAPAAKPAAKPGVKPDQPLEHDEVDGIQVPRFKTDKDFRGWGLNGYKKAKDLEGQLNGLQAKYTDLEQKVPKTEGERKQLAEQLSAIQKRYDELEQEVKYLNYERSGEYRDKYEKPYQDAIVRAHADVRELTVTEEDRSQQPDLETGKYPTRERAAVDGDFDEIYQLPLGPATKMAAKKFGPEAVSIVMQHRANIRSLAEKAVGALKEWKTNAAQRAKEQETQTIQTRERINGLWSQVNNDLREKHKDLFSERDGDDKWNAELKKGVAMADAYFSDRSAHPIEQRVVFDAHVRNRLAAFPALVSENTRLKSELEQAKKDLEQLRGSAPGKPGAVGDPNPPAEESEGAMAMFDKKL